VDQGFDKRLAKISDRSDCSPAGIQISFIQSLQEVVRTLLLCKEVGLLPLFLGGAGDLRFLI
jgi:hypothetical protein